MRQYFIPLISNFGSVLNSLMKSIVLFVVLTFFLVACSQSFEPIDYGKDACMHCKMTIVDKRYAAEMIDKKGKIFKFDDIACMMHYISENKIPQMDLNLFVADYREHTDNFLNAHEAIYIHHEFFISPMRGNTGAFSSPAEVNSLKDSLHTIVLSWNELKY